MKTLRPLLQEKKTAVVRRWLDDTLASYAPETGAFLDGGSDRFANPVGHALRTGAEGVLDDLLDGAEPEGICRHLDGMIRIRAVQEFSPSRAVAFVFLLKGAVRAALGRRVSDPALREDLASLDAWVDQVALFAFDIFVKCREQVYELRVKDVKRNVAFILDRFQGEDPDPMSDRNGSLSDAECSNS
jgi:hypothetical protein